MRNDEIKLVPKRGHDSDAESVNRVDRYKVPRAERYEISAATKYRIRGEQKWYEGAMKDISVSGLLMGAAFSLPSETLIEMRFSLPVQLAGGETPAEVHCRGSVVRSWNCEVPGDTAAMVAARIIHSRFLRQES